MNPWTHVRSHRVVGAVPPGRARQNPAAAATLAILILSACTADAEPPPPALDEAVNTFLTDVDRNDKVRAVLVSHDGRLLLEEFRGEEDDAHINLRSITKSVLSLLVGIAIDDGLIPGTDASLGDLLPAHAAGMTPELAAVTFEQVLMHTAGFIPDDDVRAESDHTSSPDWVARILADRGTAGPGDGGFAYSTAGSHIVAAVLAHAVGGSILDFARARLFDPLGIPTEPALTVAQVGDPDEIARLIELYLAADFSWPTDPQGIHDGGSLLRLRPSDVMKIGQLVLAGGAWDGAQIVSAEWIAQSTARHIPSGIDPDGYGLHWWTGELEGDAATYAVGYGGNVLAVVPDRALVAVVIAQFDGVDPAEVGEQFGMSALTLIDTVIAPAFD